MAGARDINHQVEAYRRLKKHVENYRKIQILDFDEKAAHQFEQLLQSRIRIGTMDLKIAAIVRARHATLLTRNQQDFSKVPGLKFEDWTK